MSLSDWRENRETGWTSDIGYALQDVLRDHTYLVHTPSTKAGDPGWHPCSCGWEGYWSEFHPHVADHLRAVVEDRLHQIREELRDIMTGAS